MGFAALKRRTSRIFVNVLDCALGFVMFLPGCALQISNLAIILAVGALCVALRDLFLGLIPWMLSNLTFVDDVLNVFLMAVSSVVNSIEIVIEAIENAVQFFSGQSPQGFEKLTIIQVDTKELKAFLGMVQKDCTSINNAGIILQTYFIDAFNSAVCPTLRYLWPISWLRWFFSLGVGWLSFPFDPNDSSKNCECSTEMSVCPQSEVLICTMLGLGYLVLEVILPAAVVAVGFPYFGRPLLALAWNSFVFCVLFVTEVVRDLITGVNLIERAGDFITSRLRVKI